MFLLDLSMSFSIIPGITRCSVGAWSDSGGSLLLLVLGDRLDLLSDGQASLLSVDHDLEALEVGQVGARLSLGELLGDGHGGPLVSERSLLDGPEKGARAGAALDRERQLGQRQSLQWHNHSWEVLAIDKDAVLVSNVHDGHHLSVVLSEVNESDSTCFDEVFVSLCTSIKSVRQTYCENLPEIPAK